MNVVDAMARVETVAAPYAERLRLFRRPPLSEADIARLAEAVAPRVLPDELVTYLRHGGLTPWEWNEQLDDLVRWPFDEEWGGRTGWLGIGSSQRDHLFMVLPDARSATGPIVAWSSRNLTVTPLFPSLASYLAGFVAAFPLWEASPLATDEEGLSGLSFWWVTITDGWWDNDLSIDGLETALRSLIAQEDPTWPNEPSPVWDGPEMDDPGVVAPYWLERLRITAQPRTRR